MLFNRSTDLEENGSEYRTLMEDIETDLEWTKETCII
jgi:hypothetical protein